MTDNSMVVKPSGGLTTDNKTSTLASRGLADLYRLKEVESEIIISHRQLDIWYDEGIKYFKVRDYNNSIILRDSIGRIWR